MSDKEEYNTLVAMIKKLAGEESNSLYGLDYSDKMKLIELKEELKIFLEKNPQFLI